MRRLLVPFVVGIVRAPDAFGQDADVRYRTGRALGITGVTA